MRDFYLFEAGSTKTAFVHVGLNENEEMLLPGFNPNRKYDAFQIAIEEGIKLPKGAKIIFYGSGLASDANKDIVSNLFSIHEPVSIKVYDDILGAARATCGKSPGIVAILGTGGLAAQFDGKNIVQRRGGYGYLIDDLGGGYELGKRFIATWLNGDLSEKANKILEEDLDLNPDTFTQKFYKKPDISLVSNMVPFVLRFEDEPVVKKLINDYFTAFIEQQVLPLAKSYNSDTFSIVGSVGYLFYRHITQLAKKFNLKVNHCVQNPIQRLIQYHS